MQTLFLLMTKGEKLLVTNQALIQGMSNVLFLMYIFSRIINTGGEFVVHQKRRECWISYFDVLMITT